MSSRKQQSPENLFDDLLSVAYVNKGFKNGTTGGFTLIAHQEDPLRLTDMLDPDYDGRWPTPHMIETYKFTARRLPRIHGRAVRNVIDLTCTYELTLNNTVLPVHIAEEAYGLEGQEAIDNGGPSTMEQSVSINIDNEDFEPHICEKVVYTDEEGDEVSCTCSCKLPHVEDGSFSTILFKRNLWGSESNDDDEDDDDDEKQSDTQASPLKIVADTHFTSNAPRKLETFDNFTEEEMLAIMDFQDDIERDKVYADLETASRVVRSMKRAFHRQFGMQFQP